MRRSPRSSPLRAGSSASSPRTTAPPSPSPRSSRTSSGGSNVRAPSVTTATIRSSAGSSRRARRPQNAITAMRPFCSHSTSKRLVIRYPESTKNASTPKKPPRAHGIPPWNASTAMTARPRTPSRAGTYPMPGRPEGSLRSDRPRSGQTPNVVPADTPSSRPARPDHSWRSGPSPPAQPADHKIALNVRLPISLGCLSRYTARFHTGATPTSGVGKYGV